MIITRKFRIAVMCAASIFLIHNSSFILSSSGEVIQFTTPALTASTNASATAVFTNTNYGDGVLRRVVLTLSAGLTNVDVSIVDWDGTALISTNGIGAATNAAASVTLTSGAGLLPNHWFIIKTANAQKYSTNNAGTFTATTTQEK